ncbi:diaminopimelate epimerase [Endobacter medicaginis]|uniref:Diaminopimelate epimerase n=3 Tax=Endobacter medicaginis TaxID=1181271 RepID=A0A839UZY0_9PROT|nr:diaminopimelate epimerase [Endobacter medicaginis]MBB3172849.1 diaminopimelate epimerase [Endobacter medicaginis]MCX5474776.1 diaminopimelate epimerase [Endobacter medicaginis]
MDVPLPAGLRFAKMQGAGNDFVVLDLRDGMSCPSPRQLVALANRHFGIGCDQIMTIGPSEMADAALRFFNPDGTESGACGNATRCAVVWLGGVPGRRYRLATAAGVLVAERLEDGQVRVDMGPPRLGWRDVPLAREMDTLALDLPGAPVACSMGNPHVTFFVDDLDATDVAGLGAAFETNTLFPSRANIGFAQMTGAASMRLFVWERGAGATLACGSGACAAGVAAIRRGLAYERIAIAMPGGDLAVEWRGEGVWLSGPARMVFEGRVG